MSKTFYKKVWRFLATVIVAYCITNSLLNIYIENREYNNLIRIRSLYQERLDSALVFLDTFKTEYDSLGNPIEDVNLINKLTDSQNQVKYYPGIILCTTTSLNTKHDRWYRKKRRFDYPTDRTKSNLITSFKEEKG